MEIEKVTTGIEGLDVMLKGGFEKNSIVLLSGDPGAGKTTMGLQYLYNGATKYGQPGVLISFEEPMEMIYRHAMNYGWDLGRLEQERTFRIVDARSLKAETLFHIDVGMTFDTIKSIGAKRVVIDSLTAYSLLFESAYKQRIALRELFESLRKLGCTTVMINEYSKHYSAHPLVDFLADELIMIYNRRVKNTRVRGVEIVKARGIDHVDKPAPIVFGKNGVEVFPENPLFDSL
ncbi:MAG: ATPase domain-containing protein [Candidatus Micrarchaeota archaeon]